MLHKIDPNILSSVSTLDKDDDGLEVIVYSNKYNTTKEYLHKHFKNVMEYNFINAFGVRINFVSVTKLANFESVSYITLNSKVTTCVDVSKKVLNIPQVALNINAKSKHSVVVIDTGVQSIVDLSLPKNRIVHFKDFINDKHTAYDDNGHGTFVASILAGNGLVSNGKYMGINPNAQIIALKALDGNGETGAFTILEAMQWVFDNRKKYNIKVVCMSFGSNTLGRKDPLIVGAEVLWNAGICVVSAAGNSGPEPESIKSPGASSRIITVGALNDNRHEDDEYDDKEFEMASFSSRGPILGHYKPDLIVPGVNIAGACNYVIDKHHYKKMSGTSVATPMVAGVCSLMCEVNPYISPNEMKSILIKNSKPIFYDRNSEGAGLLNCDFINKIFKSKHL